MSLNTHGVNTHGVNTHGCLARKPSYKGLRCRSQADMTPPTPLTPPAYHNTAVRMQALLLSLNLILGSAHSPSVSTGSTVGRLQLALFLHGSSLARHLL